MPRAALGYVAMPPLVVCGRLGLAPGLDTALDEAVEVSARRATACHRSVPAASNPAKELAARLVGCLPLVWGSEGIAGAAAYRLKCQLNENAKVLAGWATFPELNHNEVVGLYRSGGDVAGLSWCHVVPFHDHVSARVWVGETNPPNSRTFRRGP